MIVANLNHNLGRKIYCAVVVFLVAMSFFAWQLVVNGGQQKWLITWLAAREPNDTQTTTGANDREKLLNVLKSQRFRLYTDLKESLTRVKNSTKTRKVLETTQSEPYPRKVLILSRGRSGSSFLGDLFNENKKVFYLFEPLVWSHHSDHSYDATKFKILDDLFNCKFTQKVYLDILTKKSFFRKKSNKLQSFPGQCSRISMSSSRCLAKIMQSTCSGSNSIVAKVLTHRLPQGGVWGIRKLLDANKNLRIVHLIRDPRRVISSMINAGWLKGKNFTQTVRITCESVWENLKHLQKDADYYKDRYKLLVFTDMMLKPFSTVVELYDFLRMSPVPEHVYSWIIENTMGSSVGDNKRTTYETARNSTAVLNKKLNFTNFEEFVINRYCGNVIKFIDTVRKSP